jgi:dihydroorotase-like cyclic amidohydrolase
MSRAGMSFEQILASLTTILAERFGCFNHTGRIAKGMDADLVDLRCASQKLRARLKSIT